MRFCSLLYVGTILCCLAARAQTPIAVPGWMLRAQNPKLYALDTDTMEKHGGVRSMRLRLTAAKPDDIDDYVSAIQSFQAAAYRGKRVRLTGWMKTDKVDGGYFLFGAMGRTGFIAIDYMEKGGAIGTTPWTKYTLVLDVPQRAQSLQLRAGLQGRGQVWADDLTLDVVGNDVPTTVSVSEAEQKEIEKAEAEAEKKENGVVPPAVAALPDQPVNLDFETPKDKNLAPKDAKDL